MISVPVACMVPAPTHTSSAPIYLNHACWHAVHHKSGSPKLLGSLSGRLCELNTISVECRTGRPLKEAESLELHRAAGSAVSSTAVIDVCVPLRELMDGSIVGGRGAFIVFQKRERSDSFIYSSELLYHPGENSEGS